MAPADADRRNLTYARIEAGKEVTRVSRISIRELIGDTVELLRPDAHRKKLALQISLEDADLAVLIQLRVPGLACLSVAASI